MIRFLCVRTGTAYGIEYVENLSRAIGRHCEEESELICLTDQKETLPGVRFVDISESGLTGWWAKMLLMNPLIRGPGRSVYLDLDTIVLGDLLPLVNVEVDGMGILANLTRRETGRGPCRYGSAIMVFNHGWGASIWKRFKQHQRWHIGLAGARGDQYTIERLHPSATLLQDVLPHGYVLGRRSLGGSPPERASIVCLAGPHKPHNSPLEWVRRAWHGEI